MHTLNVFPGLNNKQTLKQKKFNSTMSPRPPLRDLVLGRFSMMVDHPSTNGFH